MRRLLLAASVFALAATAASAQQRQLSVTIYNSGQSLVEDTRTETLAAGRQRIEFKDVSPQIRSETVTLSAPGISIIEQNFDYDLLSPQTLMEKAVGETVTIVRTNPGNGQQVTERAKVLAVNNGVVLQIGDRIEILRDDGVPTRVIFDKAPPSLRARPTLSVTVDASAAGPRPAKLTYLTNGMGWNADYVALFDERNGKIDVQGWVTLSNTTGVDFTDAEVNLVAGNTGGGIRYSPPAMTSAGTITGNAVPLADYYMYPLKERTTIAQNQTKQVSFLDVIGAPARKAYRVDLGGFGSSEQPIAAAVKLEFNAGGGEAIPMPAGTVRFYVRDRDGNPKFIGENEISHTPAGSDLSIQTGNAFDVTLTPTVVTTDKRSNTKTRYGMSYVVRNARPEPVVVQVRQGGLGRDGKLVEESLPSKRLNAQTLQWDVPVPANGETVLTFTVDSGY